MSVQIRVNPTISDGELYDFYIRNNICEKDFEKEVAARVLKNSSLIVAAFDDDQLVSIARAMFDGTAACIMELSLELKFLGEQLQQNNGSVIEKDSVGLGKAIGEELLEELWKMGATFISVYIIDGLEEHFYQSLGFKLNEGHSIFYIDKRPYKKY